MQKITPFLWFNGRIEEAVAFYTSVFENTTVVSTMPGPGGTAMSATINIEGQTLILFNGGPMFTLNEAFSLSVSCNNQQEIDDKWAKLCEGGQESRCGWLKDKFGVSWQVVPHNLGELLWPKDAGKANRAMQAMLTMNKLIIADLENA